MEPHSNVSFSYLRNSLIKALIIFSKKYMNILIDGGKIVMNIGKKIKVLRLKTGITQEKLASRLNISSQSISKWENELTTPDINLLPDIAGIFGVTIDELFDLTVDQKLHSIENMLDFEDELSDQTFRETESFLLNTLESYDENHPDMPDGRIYSFLAHLYHHRMASDAVKVSEYVRKGMRLHPQVQYDMWLLQLAEGSESSDWNCKNHNRTIIFLKELIDNNPNVSDHYFELMDNLLADNRTVEAGDYLKAYRKTDGYEEERAIIYEAKIALKEHRVSDAECFFSKIEKEYANNSIAMFKLACLYADECRYDQAIASFEKSYLLEEGNARYNDALQAQAIIYEIQGQYEKSITALNKMIKNLEESFGITEGAPINVIEKEKQRLFNFIAS